MQSSCPLNEVGGATNHPVGKLMVTTRSETRLCSRSRFAKDLWHRVLLLTVKECAAE